ncbi:MAG: hypothetical protein IJW51_04090 [Clostridia bacterium]|nr:hypothetical protein [Clostridia bacterium]
MKKIIEALWHETHILPCEESFLANPQYKKLLQTRSTAREKLETALSEKQKCLLSEFDDCGTELSKFCEKEIFVRGFRLGAQLMLEMLSKE